MSAPGHIPLFIALEPDANTAGLIRDFKARTQSAVGAQLYLDHPPHMTLYAAAFASLDDVLKRTREISKFWSPPEIEIQGWHTFVGDPLTGNNTLALTFAPASSRGLRRLQRSIVETLAPHREVRATRERLKGRLALLSPAEQDAVERHGFPYIDAGWHPHLTIASIRPADWPQIARLLLPESPAGEFRCPSLQVYRLDDGHPELVETFELGSIECRAPRKVSTTTTLTRDIVCALWSVIDQVDWVRSATITGSFLTCSTLDAVSDIDLVVVADQLTARRFEDLQQWFTEELGPVLAAADLELRINTTLGPRKLNEPDNAVLHLMVYSCDSHRQHAVRSPFTCLDWQRSPVFRKRSLESIYPVFALQPRHFLDARRSPRDYLRDFDRGVVSYREIVCGDASFNEIPREQKMSVRDRDEYAYHVQRFLMRNLLKLLWRRNEAPDGESLLERYFDVFPRDADRHGRLFRELKLRKETRDFSDCVPHLDERLRTFVIDFESQFRGVFAESATRHIVFRHAATLHNGGASGGLRFLGRTDPEIMQITDEQLSHLVAVVKSARIETVHSSPLTRCRQSLEPLARICRLPHARLDARLIEVDYGQCEQMTIADARRAFPRLFHEWAQGADPRFPGGESTADVTNRVQSFAREHWDHASGNTLVCTHNVVLRTIVGNALGIPQRDWHRIQVPHLAPITLVQTRDYGRFLDLDESVELQMFTGFFDQAYGAVRKFERDAA